MSHEKSGLPEPHFSGEFTPERIQQISDLIARGETYENIAALIGVTAGTLKVTAGGATATLSIRMQYNGQERETALPLTSDMTRRLAFEASSRDQKIAELARDLVEAVAHKDLFEKPLADIER
jgi:hypothetical protein